MVSVDLCGYERPIETEAVISKQELGHWLLKVIETLHVFLCELVRDNDRRSHSTDFVS